MKARKREERRPARVPRGGQLPLTARARATRLRLLAAAEDEFTIKGYHRTSIGHITMRACVGVGTFYLYFSDKQDVLCTLVRDLSGQLARGLSACVAQGRTSAQRLRLRAYVQFRTTHPGLDRIVNAVEWVDGRVFRDYYQSLARELQLDRQASVPATAGDGTAAVRDARAIDEFLRLWKAISTPSHKPDLDVCRVAAVAQ